MIKRLLREFFLLSRGEQRGLLAAAIFLFLAIIFRFIINFWRVERPVPDYEFMDEALEIYEEIIASKNEVEIPHLPIKSKPERRDLILHPFDPNNVSLDELMDMNVPLFAASNLVKFREAGGSFDQPDDLLRIYGIDSSLLVSLKPYLVISKQKVVSKQDEKSEIDINRLLIELNRADSAVLVKLPGIGPVLSARIIRYRDLLGGFTSLSQLSEVYGLESYDFSRLKSLVKVDPDMILKINLNGADYGQLLRHPYLSRKEVVAILEYRDFAGTINSPEELYTHLEWDSIRWLKVRAYLDIAEGDTTLKKLLQ